MGSHSSSSRREAATQPRREGSGLQRGVSEFGEVLGDIVSRTPGARGAVLSDGVDDTIDTAYRAGDITAIDVSIAGAQVGQTMVRLTLDAQVHGFGRPQVVIETERGIVISKLLVHEYLLTVVLHRQANLARAMREFDAAAQTLLELLE